MAEAGGYILRIATEEWVDQVFDMAIYYTSTSRKWVPGQTLLFVHKTSLGDAFVGYGVIEAIREKDDLSEDERHMCEEHGWKRAIEFQYVKRFEKPLPIKETVLKGTKLRGRFLHGLQLGREQVDSIISRAESP